jgi:hypothetical protein
MSIQHFQESQDRIKKAIEVDKVQKQAKKEILKKELYMYNASVS